MSRVRDSLVVLQVAETVVLLVGSGLLVRSLLRLGHDAGFHTSQVAILRLFQAPVPSPFGDSPEATDPAKAQRATLLDLRPLTIVGIVGDVRLDGQDTPHPPVIYTCHRQPRVYTPVTSRTAHRRKLFTIYFALSYFDALPET